MESMLMTSSVFPETCPLLNNIPSSPLPPSIKVHNTKRTGSLRFAQNPHFISLRLPALARHVSGGDGDDQGPSTNGSAFFSDETLSLPQTITGFIKWLLRLSSDGLSHVMKDNINQSESSEKDAEKILKVETPLIVPHGNGTGGGARAGLFRTPISGGVQSATSAHGLPRPALAVRNLMEQARFAHLCTVMSRMHHRREGYPFGSLVDFAPDSMGHPIFSFSPLAIHTRNLLVDPRCTLVVQIPGWSGLSNARVTIFGDVFPLPEHQQEWAHKQYIAKHQQGPSQQWGNFYYFRMQNISDIYFIGGFGTVAWVDVKEYEALQPDKIAVDGGEQNLKELNAIFSKPLKELLSSETEVDDAAFISIDSKGTDIRVRQGAQFNIQRLSFEDGHVVETLEEAKAALWKLINKGQVHGLQK
uniref:CREG-like beta-barrel domain-containing protein n=1 Tax=Populus davidiana TaxID=266767 RepID=A0A6M2EBR6_9ROSI